MPPICRQFASTGSCRRGTQCTLVHLRLEDCTGSSVEMISPLTPTAVVVNPATTTSHGAAAAAPLSSATQAIPVAGDLHSLYNIGALEARIAELEAKLEYAQQAQLDAESYAEQLNLAKQEAERGEEEAVNAHLDAELTVDLAMEAQEAAESRAQEAERMAKEAAQAQEAAVRQAGEAVHAQEAAERQAEEAVQAKKDTERVAKEANKTYLKAGQRALEAAEEVRKARRAQAEAEEKARSEAERAAHAETVAKYLADSVKCPSLGHTTSSGSGSGSSPPPYSLPPSGSLRRASSSSDTDSYLLKKRQQAAAQEYAVTIQRIVSGSTLATFGPGLDLQSLICGFDNGLIELYNVPPQATAADIEALFTAISTRCCIVDIRQYEDDKIIATVAVREDIKQRVAEAVNGQMIRNKPVSARVLTTAAGYAASRHHALYLSWKGQDPPRQTFYADLRERLVSTRGIMSYEPFSNTKRLIPTSLPGGGNTQGAVAWFNSETSAKQALDSFHLKRFAPDFPLIQCTLGSNKPLKYALVVPLEQYYIHESGDTIRYPDKAVVAEPGDITARTKLVGYDWFDGWRWSDDERNRTFFGKDVRRQVPGILMTKWDYLTRTLILYADCEAAITQASDIIESHAGKSKLGKFSERIDPRFTKSLIRSGRLEVLKKELVEGDVSFKIFRSQHVLAYRGRNAFFAVRRLMEVIESGGLPAEDDDGKATCPVCLSEVSASVKLICGHEYCISCLKRCVLTSPERNSCPIVCVSDEGKCQWRIAIPVIQSLLSPLELQKLLEKVVQAYTNQHPDQFRYCITPGCTQIYRCSRLGAAKYLTCTSCSVTVCSACHSKAHSFLSCADWRRLSRPTQEERLTSQWTSRNGTKKCPKCEVIINKTEGCHHVHCPMCHTHICWVCLGTFKDNTEIYTHLSIVHGGIDGQATNAQAVEQDFQFAQRLQAEELAKYSIGTNDSDNRSSCIIM